MERVDKSYQFDGPDGSLHHFMWSYDVDAEGNERPCEAGCPSCRGAADQIPRLQQLHARRTTLVAVSRVPYATLAAFRDRMGWDLRGTPRPAATSTTTSTPPSTSASEGQEAPCVSSCSPTAMD